MKAKEALLVHQLRGKNLSKVNKDQVVSDTSGPVVTGIPVDVVTGNGDRESVKALMLQAKPGWRLVEREVILVSPADAEQSHNVDNSLHDASLEKRADFLVDGLSIGGNEVRRHRWLEPLEADAERLGVPVNNRGVLAPISTSISNKTVTAIIDSERFEVGHGQGLIKLPSDSSNSENNLIQMAQRPSTKFIERRRVTIVADRESDVAAKLKEVLLMEKLPEAA